MSASLRLENHFPQGWLCPNSIITILHSNAAYDSMVETWAYRSIKLLWILLAKTKFSDLIYMSDRLSKLICILDKCLGAILLKDLFYRRLKVIEWRFCRETFVFWSALQNTGVEFRINQHSETYMHLRSCLEGFRDSFSSSGTKGNCRKS